MNKSVLFAAAAIAALCCSAQVFAQSNGTAGGMDPSGNSSFGGGNAGSGSFGDYAAALRLIRQEQYGDAIPYLEHVLTDRPHSADVLDNLGYTHTKIGEFRAALAFLKKAIAINSDHQKAHEHLGELYLAMKDPADADAQLVELTRICADGCTERDALTKAIADYRAAAGAAPAQ